MGELLVERPISTAEIAGRAEGVFDDIYLSFTGEFNRDARNKLFRDVFENTVFLWEKIADGYSTEMSSSFIIKDEQTDHQIEIFRQGNNVRLKRTYNSLKKAIPILEEVSLRRTFDTNGTPRYLGNYSKIEQDKKAIADLFG